MYNPILLTSIFATDLDKQRLYICVSFLLFRNSVELSSPASYSSCNLFELRPLLYRHEFVFPSAWGVFISLLVWKGFYICKITFYIKNKQASPAQI